MTNAESKQQYEGAILNQLIKNSERLVVVERDIEVIKNEVRKIDNLSAKLDTFEGKLDTFEEKLDTFEGKLDTFDGKIDYIYKYLKWIIGLLGAVLIAVLANLLSQPILNLF